MAYDIGPRIGIEGEAEFRRTINQIISTQRTLATEMDAVSSAFDRNDQSQEALTAKNEVLNRQIDTQKEKLAALQRGLEAAAERYGENDRVTQGWQQAVNRATADLNRLERQLSENNEALQRSGEAVDDLGESMDDAGDSASVFSDVLKADLVANGLEKVAESATEAAKSVLSFAMTSEASIGTLRAQLGITKDQAADLSAVAKAIWSDGFGESLDDATESVVVIRQMLGDLAEDEMGSIAKSALALKKVFGIDVSESIRTVKTLMQNFGLTAQQAFDYIVVGYQKGLNFSDDLLDTLNEYTSKANTAGFTANEYLSLLSTGLKNGVKDIDSVADAINEFSNRIIDGSTATQEGLALIGLDYDTLMKKLGDGSLTSAQVMQLVINGLEKQDDVVKQNMAGASLFGSLWEDKGAKTVFALGGVTDALGDVEGATRRAGEAANDNLGAKLELALRGIQSSIEPLVEQVIDSINNIMPQVKELIEWISDNGPSVAVTIAGIGAAFLTWKVSSMISGLVLAIQTLSGGLATATAAQLGLNAATVANPIGAIVTAIVVGVTLLVAGIMTLWNTNEGFRNAVIGAWTAISQTAQNVWGSITTFFTQTIPNAITLAISWFSLLPTNISNFFGQIPGMVSNFFASALASISAFGSNIISWVATTIPKFVDSFIAFVNELPGKIGYALGFALGSIIKFGIDAVDWVLSEVPKIITGIITFFSELPGKIATTFVNVITEFGKWGTSAISWVVTEVPNLILRIVNFYAELPGKIAVFLSQVLTNLGTWIANMASSAATEIPKVITTITNLFESLPGKMLDIGSNIVKGLWDGIENSVSWLLDRIKDFAEGIIDGFKDAFDINSPSRAMRGEVGLMLGTGLAAGIEDSINQVKAAMAQLNRIVMANVDISANIKTTQTIQTNQNGTGASNVAGGILGALLHVDEIVISNDMDIQELANKLGFYYQQAVTAKGGG